jgi:hypothetical protein
MNDFDRFYVSLFHCVFFFYVFLSWFLLDLINPTQLLGITFS